ncbi:MAG TPA: hypothetical protein VMS98_05010 [Thermoanaerobaculia bacterium]|nr:hypothetical protein [Thermoanaerobaculia bacterium]
MQLSDRLQSAITSAGAKVRFRYPWWLRPFLFPGIAGITLGRRIYLSPRVSQQQVERFLRHELAHVRQIARLGLARFYWAYGVEYIRLRRRGMSSPEAYRNISFEMEAAAAEETV